MELAAVLGQCKQEMENLNFVARLRQVADRSPRDMLTYACALLLVACERRAEPMAEVLAEAASNTEFRRFYLWLPFILDHLWHPLPDENGLIPTAAPPLGASREQLAQAERAFGCPPQS